MKLTLTSTDSFGVMAGSDGLFYQVGMPLSFDSERMANRYGQLKNDVAIKERVAYEALYQEGLNSIAALDMLEETLKNVQAFIGGQNA